MMELKLYKKTLIVNKKRKNLDEEKKNYSSE
jgi:hypothetical protein